MKKKCQKCQRKKELEEFGNDKSRNDGKYSYCLQCGRDYHKARRAKHRTMQVAVDENAIKRCSKCKRNKKAKMFPRSSPGTTSDGLLGWCRKCVAGNRRNHYWKNPDKYKDASAARHATKQRVSVEIVHRRKVHRRDGGCCYMCGDPVPFEQMHLEHKIPLSRGGAHSYANCATACCDCNLRKGDRLPEEMVSGQAVLV